MLVILEPDNCRISGEVDLDSGLVDDFCVMAFIDGFEEDVTAAFPEGHSQRKYWQEKLIEEALEMEAATRRGERSSEHYMEPNYDDAG